MLFLLITHPLPLSSGEFEESPLEGGFRGGEKCRWVFVFKNLAEILSNSKLKSGEGRNTLRPMWSDQPGRPAMRDA